MPKAVKAQKKRQEGTAPSSAPYCASSQQRRSSNNVSEQKGRRTGGTGVGANLLTPNVSLGQHFLKNPAIITAIVAKAALQATDTVLEIGSGTGNMTMPILERCKQVIAIECDSRMVRELLKRASSHHDNNRLRVIQGDAIHTDFPPHFDVLLANIPYQISSPLIFKLLSPSTPKFRCAVLLLQEEFALRLTAQPGEALYCRLSVNVQLLAKVHQLFKVGKANFRPPPKVESRVVRIEVKNPRPLVNYMEWDGMIRLLFNRKNKTIRSVLLGSRAVLKLLEDNYHQTTLSSIDNNNNNNDDTIINRKKSVKEMIEEITEKEEWKGKRASKLGLDDFLYLLSEFNTRGIHFSS